MLTWGCPFWGWRPRQWKITALETDAQPHWDPEGEWIPFRFHPRLPPKSKTGLPPILWSWAQEYCVPSTSSGPCTWSNVEVVGSPLPGRKLEWKKMMCRTRFHHKHCIPQRRAQPLHLLPVTSLVSLEHNTVRHRVSVLYVCVCLHMCACTYTCMWVGVPTGAREEHQVSLSITLTILPRGRASHWT